MPYAIGGNIHECQHQTDFRVARHWQYRHAGRPRDIVFSIPRRPVRDRRFIQITALVIFSG